MSIALTSALFSRGYGRARGLAKLAAMEAAAIRGFMPGKPPPAPSLVGMTLDEDDVAIATRWLNRSVDFGDEELVHSYEDAFARWNGSPHAVAFLGGRVALSACIAALELSPGDEVIVPGYTCVVVPNAFRYAAVDVVYCDIELDTYGPSLEDVERKIGPKTRAILVHHLYGLVCRDFEGILRLARERGLRVIEDCAHATGATFLGKKVGNFGDLAFYSSEQSKVYTTIQGGVAVAQEADLARRIRRYQALAPVPGRDRIERLLKMVPFNYYSHKHPLRVLLGPIADYRYGSARLQSTGADELDGVRPTDYGCRFAAPLAEIGLNQLGKIDAYNAERRREAKRWDQWCVQSGFAPPRVIENSVPVFLRYPVRVRPEQKEHRAWARAALGVSPGVWFVSQLHPAPGPAGDCPNARVAVDTCINLPCIRR